MREAIEAGTVFEMAYPFILDDETFLDEGGPYTDKSWRPGVRFEYTGSAYLGNTTESIADGMGKQIITVVSTHKPGRFPLRVFYTRQWITPAGKQFGKGGCRVASITGFRGLIGGYRYPVDRVAPTPRGDR